MPGCSALNCTNSSEKGFLMKIFPRDPKRRIEWVINMNRGNWNPTQYACLCEVHFAPEMWEKTRVDGKRKLKSHAIPTIFSSTILPHQRKFVSLKQPSFAIDAIDNENRYKDPDIGDPLEPENIEKIINTEIDEPAFQEDEATLVQPPQMIILPDQSASTIHSSNTVLQAVKTLQVPKQSSTPNDSWFKNAATAILRINTNLSYSVIRLEKEQSSASNAKEHEVFNKLQEILNSSINSMIQIRKNLRAEFISSINSTKFFPKTASASSAQKRKLPESSQDPAKRLRIQNSPTPIRIVLSNSTATTSHTIPATSHTIPATSHTIPATSHTIPATSHTIPAIYHTIPATYRTIPATFHTIPATYHTIPVTYRTIPATSHTITLKPHTASKGYLKVKSFGQLQTDSFSEMSVPEVVNETEKDPLEDDENIAEDKSENSKDDVYEPEKPLTEIIADMVTNGVEQNPIEETLQIKQEDCEYTENSDESENINDIKIEHIEIPWDGISEGNNSEQNGHFTKCSENFVGDVEVKSEPEEYLYRVEDCSVPRKLSEEG